MRLLMALTHVMYLILAVIALDSVRSEPEFMTRLTRPEVFSDPDELRQYLEFIRGYYSLNGKARYGKRRDFHSMERLQSQQRNLAIAELARHNLQNVFQYNNQQEQMKSKIGEPCDIVVKYIQSG